MPVSAPVSTPPAVFKVERGEVVREVAYELAVAEVVAVAVDDLATKKSAVLVTFEFALYVR